MKGKGKRGEVPFKDELPFNPVRRTEARTVGGGGGWRSRAMRIGKQLTKFKKKKIEIKFLDQGFLMFLHLRSVNFCQVHLTQPHLFLCEVFQKKYSSTSDGVSKKCAFYPAEIPQRLSQQDHFNHFHGRERCTRACACVCIQ